MNLKRGIYISILILGLLAFANISKAQCSICTKTAQQLGERPAQGMNAGILYLMAAPLAIMGFVGYRWWKNNRD
jgi:hypothetical protein